MPDLTETPDPSTKDYRDAAEIAGIEDVELQDGHAEEEAASDHQEAVDAAPDEDREAGSPGPDLSFLDKEILRDTLASVIRHVEPDKREEFLNELKRGYLREADYTRKRQVESKKAQELDSLADDGRKWQALIQDKKMLDHILSFGKGKPDPQEDYDLPDDILALSPKDIKSLIERQVEDRLKREREDIERSVENRLYGPQRHLQALDSAALEWAEVNGVDNETLTSAVEEVIKDFGRENIMSLQPDLLVRTLPTIVKKVQLEAQLKSLQSKQEDTSRRVARARTASPKGGAGAASPDALSPAQVIRQREKDLGRSLTRDELENVAFEAMLSQLGKNEADLDGELRERGAF